MYPQPTVWIDLDETLIAWFSSPVPGSIKLGTERWAILRPGARECLASLRNLAPVRLLTYAKLSYACVACEAFGLGFPAYDILAQELWTSFLREQPSLGRPGDVLVEDDRSGSVAAKCRFVGIVQQRVVIVPAYVGGPDDAMATVPQQVGQLLRSDAVSLKRQD